MAVPIIYNYWAILGLDIFAIIFWLTSMSLLADEVAAYSWVATGSGDGSCFYDYAAGEYLCYRKRSVISRRGNAVLTYRNSLAAACGLGGLELYGPSASRVFLIETKTHIFLASSSSSPSCFSASISTATARVAGTAPPGSITRMLPLPRLSPPRRQLMS